MKAAAIASMAASTSAFPDCVAKCFKEKRARKRTGRGVSSEHRDCRKLLIVGSIGSIMGAIAIRSKLTAKVEMLRRL